MSKVRVALIGCTPLGIALGSALRQAFPEAEIVGHDRDAAAMQRAETSGAIHKRTWNIPAACEGAAAVFIFGADAELRLVLDAIREDVMPGALVVRVGGSAQQALALARERLPNTASFFATQLVRSPVAASEMSLQQAVWAVTPRTGTDEASVEQFLALARALGAVPVLTDAQESDGMRLATVALPLLLGAAWMHAVSGDPAWQERRWAAGAEAAAFTQALGEDVQEILTHVLDAPQVAVHWLNQVMLACMALRDALAEGETEKVSAWLREAQTRHAEWLSAWRQGRTTLAPTSEPPRTSLLDFFLGERLAERLRGARQSKA